MAPPILVTGAAGRVGAVGRTVTELLLKQGKRVRAMVRTEDERAQALRDKGAEVVVGNLLDLDSMHRAIAGCETMYFGMSISPDYLAATVNTAAVAKYHGVKALINMSQMTLSQMSITETTASPQHKLQWLAEQALDWSGLPVVHVRPTVFSGRLFPDTHLGSGGEFKSDQTAVWRGQDFADLSGGCCACRRRAACQSGAAHQQNLSPDGPTVREHAFLCAGVFEGAWPNDHLSGHSGRVLARGIARAALACLRREPSCDDGRSAPRGTLRSVVRRRAQVNRPNTAERAGLRQEECGYIYKRRVRWPKQV